MKKKIAAIACACLALAMLLLLIGKREVAQSRSGSDPQVSSPTSPVSRSPALVGPFSAAPPVTEMPGTDTVDSRAAAIAKVKGVMDIYRSTMVYPLWSRPADGSNRHITDWNRPLAMGQPFAADKDRREIRADMTLDRMYVAPGEAVKVSITCAYVEGGEPVVPDVVSAVVEWSESGQPWQPAEEISLANSGNAFVGWAVPSKMRELQKGSRAARVRGYVRYGEFDKQFPIEFRYAAELPLVVRGVADDRVADGSLEIALDVEVKTVAPVLMQATLFDASGKIAVSVFDDYLHPTQAGRQRLPIRFFGKVLHDRGIDGPYRLRGVHGFVYRADLEHREIFFSRADEPAMLTRPYVAASFSASEFDSPEKQAKLAQYQRLLDSFQTGH